MTIRTEILCAAESMVNGDRQADYGTPEDNFRNIAGLWSAYLGREVSPVDVAAMMILLKVARTRACSKRRDSWIDIAGYAACGAEAACRS